MPHLIAQRKPASAPDVPRELQEGILLMAAALLSAARQSGSTPTAVPTTVIVSNGLPSRDDIDRSLASIALALPCMAPDLCFVIYTTASACSIDECCRRGDLALLQWWHRLESPSLPPSGKLHSHAPRCRRRQTQIHYSQQAMTLATSGNHVHVLDWWHSNATSWVMKFEKRLLDGAARRAHLPAIQWWFRNKFASPFHPAWDFRAQGVLREAVENGHWEIVEWWIETGMTVEPLGEIMVDFVKANPQALQRMLSWLQNSGFGDKVFESKSDYLALLGIASSTSRVAASLFPTGACATGEAETALGSPPSRRHVV
ncbi:hypothetical protein BCR44DRAFT_41884 [Catenaria anguillulae PL171]|uniref:Uncharacterized protein n=1 Tax=Catenaria anguillulae PL171 TaxID=765915 RepID=A0A1Y2HG71_9FUNG|nr:hypothetical protein BCR44DRAFT_41884 [Catenaria anguillulae PL171]